MPNGPATGRIQYHADCLSGQTGDAPALKVHDPGPVRSYFLDTRQITLPTSSDTSSDPSLETATPTGRPSTDFALGLGSKPLRKLTGLAVGSPSLKGTNTTIY